MPKPKTTTPAVAALEKKLAAELAAMRHHADTLAKRVNELTGERDALAAKLAEVEAHANNLSVHLSECRVDHNAAEDRLAEADAALANLAVEFAKKSDKAYWAEHYLRRNERKTTRLSKAAPAPEARS